jgi:hypothetical protein
MEPMVHYIPLKKDFSNLGEVIALIRDDAVCREIAETAYRDLIASGRYGYERFVAGVDETLDAAGVGGPPGVAVERDVARALALRSKRRRWRRLAEWAALSVIASPPAQRLVRLVHPVTAQVRRILAHV